MQKTLGGDRLGSGKKMKVELHNYERSTHDLGYLWRSTMSSGTLVPFMVEVALPGDTFDINLGCDIKTHPTIGPLFGSYKVQLDVFFAPIRLYINRLHNNTLGIGMNMADVKLPLISLPASPKPTNSSDINTSQINPSSILAYLGIRGVGIIDNDPLEAIERTFNALPLLSYWDIYKNYYANKQEEIGAVIHGGFAGAGPALLAVKINGVDYSTIIPYTFQDGDILSFETAAGEALLAARLLEFSSGEIFSAEQVTLNQTYDGIDTVTALWNYTDFGNRTLINARPITATDLQQVQPTVATFDLANIDNMRTFILTAGTSPLIITEAAEAPYGWIAAATNGFNNMLISQEGLAVKTYQSDIFNNWLSTEWIDGTGGINDITSIDTSGGSFNIDTLNLSRKVYNMLNRIAVSGGSYDDWLDAVYAHPRYWQCTTPMYMGGLIKELVFQEITSNAAAGDEQQPLGTLAGKGIMAKKHKGGSIRVKVDEPGYIIGLISLTPRIDYSQGNRWDTTLTTMDDFHKPALDEIGFQELLTEKMAWWTTWYDTVTDTWERSSAGKQPAWLDYMTNYNRTYGNFAIETNEMFMTLNRKYEVEDQGFAAAILDLTTYIDPVKYNSIFAQTALDAQNFWTQIAVDITARRKMSAKLMPNL